MIPCRVYFSLIAPSTPTHHVLDSIPQFGIGLEGAPENLSIDEQLWRQFQIECVKRKTSASQKASGLLEQQLQQWQQEDATHPTSSDGGCPNRAAVYRKDLIPDGPLDSYCPARSLHVAAPPASPARPGGGDRQLPRGLFSWLLATSPPPGPRQG